MKKLNVNDILTAVALIVIGGLFMFYKSEVISIAMSLISFTLVALGVVDLLRGFTLSAIVKLVFGLLVLATGWLFVSLALYVLGAFLLIAGVTQLYAFTKIKIKKSTFPLAVRIAQPAIDVLVAICLFFNQGGALSWVFTVSGLFLVIDGAVGLAGALLDRK